MAIKDDERTRKERRAEARAKREELERQQAAAASRRRRLTWIGGGLAVVAVVAVIAIVAASGGGQKSPAGGGGGTGAAAGLQVTPAPWAPEYDQLATRINAMNLPVQSDVVYHVHTMLRIYVNGTQVPVPANIGIDPQGQFLAPLHTHDASGIIHLEANQAYPFTLGQVFQIWGVKFTSTQLGSYVANGTNVLAAYANGQRLADPVNYRMKPHDLIVVGYGKPGSFPTSYKAAFPSGE